MLGFGFALFLMLVILAVVYAQYAVRDESVSSERRSPRSAETPKTMTPSDATVMPLPAAVTPDTAADDLIDEALADRDDLSAFADDEAADAEEGSATINSLNTVYDESANQ
jgi:hypothetical protein